MKNFFSSKKQIGFAILFLLSLYSRPAWAQTDTLHLDYHHTQIQPHDSTVAKIEKWAKKLNGKHVDIQVVAYYHKLEFKKFSQERCDEIFLVLNRKARDLITIQSIGPKKGENYQRTRVDIIYKRTVTAAEAAEIAAKQKAEAEAAKAAKAEEKKKADEAKTSEKAAKEGDKKEKEGEKKGAEKKTKSEVAAEQTEKGDKKSDKKDDKKGEKEEEQDEADYGQASSRKYGEGYTMTLEEVKYVKAAKFIVAQTGNKDLDAKLNSAVKDFWDFTSTVVQMPYDEAIKMGKENKKDTMVIFSFIQVKTWFEERYGPVKVRVPKVGYALAIENGKGKLLTKQIIPKNKGQAPTSIHFAFAVSYLNNLCKVMDENNIPKSGKADAYFDAQASELKKKTLIVSDVQINKNLPHEEIPQYYTSPLNIVTEKTWEESILQKKDVAYCIVVNLPVSPKVCAHYLMDAKTGKTYLIDYGGMGLSTGWAGGNLAASQSGSIDKANFQRYEKGINKAIEDTADRKEDKAKEAEKKEEKAAKKAKAEEEKKGKEKEKKEKK